MKRFAILIILTISLISCLKDSETLKKERLFLFFDKMKTAIINDDTNWLKNNALDKNNTSLENARDIKNFFDSNNSEYSATINYNIKASDLRIGSFIIRNEALSPVYYYIKLNYNSKKNKWLIESIDKLPIS